MATRKRKNNRRNNRNKKQANQSNRVTSRDIGRMLIGEPKRLILTEVGDTSWLTKLSKKGDPMTLRSKTAKGYFEKMAKAL